MKQIKIKGYKHEKKVYTVGIGNGISREFENRKHCAKFLTDCSRYLTVKLFEANKIYAELFLHYRRNWFYFDHNKGPDAELYQAERSCRQNLENIEKTFDVMVQRSGWMNGNHFVFSHFKAAFGFMKAIITDLQRLQRSKSNAVDVHELQVIKLRIIALQQELYSYDGTPSKLVFDAEEFFDRNKMKAV